MSEHGPGIIRRTGTAAAAVLALAACAPGARTGATDAESSPTATTATSAAAAAQCLPYEVYAQNRWPLFGAAERLRPDIGAPQIFSFDGNDVIDVDFWVDTGKPVYPDNTPPWNSSVWFHVVDADGSDGWVSYA